MPDTDKAVGKLTDRIRVMEKKLVQMEKAMKVTEGHVDFHNTLWKGNLRIIGTTEKEVAKLAKLVKKLQP